MQEGNLVDFLQISCRLEIKHTYYTLTSLNTLFASISYKRSFLDCSAWKRNWGQGSKAVKHKHIAVDHVATGYCTNKDRRWKNRHDDLFIVLHVVSGLKNRLALTLPTFQEGRGSIVGTITVYPAVRGLWPCQPRPHGQTIATRNNVWRYLWQCCSMEGHPRTGCLIKVTRSPSSLIAVDLEVSAIWEGRSWALHSAGSRKRHWTFMLRSCLYLSQ